MRQADERIGKHCQGNDAKVCELAYGASAETKPKFPFEQVFLCFLCQIEASAWRKRRPGTPKRRRGCVPTAVIAREGDAGALRDPSLDIPLI